MKKSRAVIQAQEALKAKQEQLASAKAAVKTLEVELAAAYQAVTDAQTEDDSKLPQCRVVSAHWRTGKVVGGTPHVILRRTPTGILVLRHVGRADGYEYKFKWNDHRQVFVSAEKTDSYTSDRAELRDVPAQFLPTKEST